MEDFSITEVCVSCNEEKDLSEFINESVHDENELVIYSDVCCECRTSYIGSKTYFEELCQTGWVTEKDQVIKKILDKIEKTVSSSKNVLPPRENIFRIFKAIRPEDVKVLILGQDPYPTKGHACGYAFSYDGKKSLPASLRNIFTELVSDGFTTNKTGKLDKWVDQGVFLLNTALTVEEGNAGCHVELWKEFTKNILKKIKKPYVAILWGGKAQAYSFVIKNGGGKIVASVHPSPMSAASGFFGSKPFSRTNGLLQTMRIDPIDWNLC